MAACRSDVRQGVGRLKPDTLVLLLLAAWWVLNLLQAALTGLADDEAYYWYFAQHLDWGYYDHPPMVALLVRLSSWLPGLLGIRFFSTLLQPLYLLLFWHLVRPDGASRADALLYVLLCFSQPLLQLYGFLTVPDAPLMMSMVLFLWAYRRFYRRNDLGSALLLGATVALLGYSKYHGALVVLLVLAANPKVFARPRLYVAGAVALLLFLPHLWWQHSHEWVSLRYHLVGRNAWHYRASFTLEYLLLVLLVFNPLWLYRLVRGLRRAAPDADTAMRRAYLALLAGFVLFFLVATLRGRVQPQWLQPAVLPVVALVWGEARGSRRVRTAALVCAGLFGLVRLLLVANPMHLRGQLWEGREPYDKLAAVAGDRPVEFVGCYSFAAKYAYYTGKPTHCSSFFYSRGNQWQYDTTDRTFAGREVLVADLGDLDGTRLDVDARRNIKYLVMPHYQPLRELRMRLAQPPDLRFPRLPGADPSLPEQWVTRPADIELTNPYPFPIVPDTLHPIILGITVQWDERHAANICATLTDTLAAHATTRLRPQLAFPHTIPDGTHSGGLAIGYRAYAPAAGSPQKPVTVAHDSAGVSLRGNW